MTDPDVLDRMSQEWAEPRGLIMVTRMLGSALAPILRGGREPEVWRRTGEVAELLDHCRYFRLPTMQKPAVAISAPYATELLEEFGAWERVVETARSAASEAGLVVRVGVESDIIYRGGEPEIPVVPFVWWDRSRIDLETIEITKRMDLLEALIAGD